MRYKKAFAELIVIEKGDVITTSGGTGGDWFNSSEEPHRPGGGSDRPHRPDDRPHRP